MARVYKKHPPEFKNRAVKMVLEQKKPKAQVARDLGISCSTLDLWISKFEDSGDSGGDLRTKSDRSPEKQRIQSLERQVEELKMERDILKKAAAYFAKESL